MKGFLLITAISAIAMYILHTIDSRMASLVLPVTTLFFCAGTILFAHFKGQMENGALILLAIFTLKFLFHASILAFLIFKYKPGLPQVWMFTFLGYYFIATAALVGQSIRSLKK